MPSKRATYALSVFAILTLALAGCSGQTLKIDDTPVSNADAFLKEADAAFKKKVKSLGDGDVITTAKDAQCYFEATEDVVGETVYCGPVKMLGEKNNWITGSFTSKTGRDDKILLSDASIGGFGSPSEKLVRPGSGGPSDPKDLAAPLGPRTTETDFAVLLPISEVPAVDIVPVEKPVTIIQPAAKMDVVGDVSLDTIPSAALEALSSPSDISDDTAAPSFRPAEGQTLSAWQVKVGPPPEFTSNDPSNGYFQSEDDPRDASLSLAVITGTTRLPVAVSRNGGGFDPTDSAEGMAVISCDSAPCKGPGADEYLLIVSAGSKDVPHLLATTDGSTEDVPLDGSDPKRDHSSAAYDLASIKTQVSQSWGTKTFDLVTGPELGAGLNRDSVTMSFGGSVSEAFLTPFDRNYGWAPAGKAWLVVPVMNAVLDSSSSFKVKPTVDWTKSWTAVSGKNNYSAEQEKQESVAVFAVDAKDREFEIAFAPQGDVAFDVIDANYATSTQQKTFAAPEPLTVKVAFK